MLVSCGHATAPRMRTSTGTPLRQCLPGAHIVIFDHTLTLDQYQAARSSLVYWNQFGFLFIDGGHMQFDLADAAQGFTVVTFEPGLEHGGMCGLTTVGAYATSGCIAESVIRINPACAGDLGKLATTLRHELGHVLGLDHSDDPHALMFDAQNAAFKGGDEWEIRSATTFTE